MSDGARYDRIGDGYAQVRVPDPRIAALIEEALGDAVSVVNVGAGAGSYESPGRKVLAVEPLEAMIRQRRLDAAPAVLGVAESLPLVDASVDACTAFLTVHHWSDARRGLRELRRVSRKRVVLFTYVGGVVPDEQRRLSHYYFPLIERADQTLFPHASAGLYAETLGPVEFVSRAHPLGLHRRFPRRVLGPPRVLSRRTSSRRRLWVPPHPRRGARERS